MVHHAPEDSLDPRSGRVLARGALRGERARSDEQLGGGRGERIQLRTIVMPVGVRRDVFRRVRRPRRVPYLIVCVGVSGWRCRRNSRFKSSRARHSRVSGH